MNIIGINMLKLGLYSNQELIEKVRSDFSIFRKRFFGILIFGSRVKNSSTSISDIDVCIVLKESSKLHKSLLYHEVYPKIRMDVYDVVIFENCDDYLKSEIAKNHIIVYSIDENVLEEYLEPYKSLSFKKKSLIKIIGEIKGVAGEL
ncbi:MAG TPA: nucleotidyltransferase domain-containing protein [Methanosarcinaceae archaeon]|nr:nucleotidyltransferase domain-containing protein [Methanosarcinaceae archaeon]